MKQYNLGPNGAIMTALNLFATKFHQIMGLLEVTISCQLFWEILIDEFLFFLLSPFLLLGVLVLRFTVLIIISLF